MKHLSLWQYRKRCPKKYAKCVYQEMISDDLISIIPHKVYHDAYVLNGYLEYIKKPVKKR